jgi:hypothetical protein
MYYGYPVSFSGVKRTGRGIDHPTPSTAEFKESIAIPPLPLWVFITYTYLLTPWSRVLLEKLTSELCS